MTPTYWACGLLGLTLSLASCSHDNRADARSANDADGSEQSIDGKPVQSPSESADAAEARGAAASAVADIQPTSGNPTKGRLTFVAVDGGVHVEGTVAGLTDGGLHGFHVHEKGDCSAPDGKSAGDHFNPSGHPHGNPGEGHEHHLGDMNNLKADSRGNAAVDFVIQGATLGGGGPTDILGRAVIVHQAEDDYSTQPSGNSGARIACGVIANH